MRYPSNSALAVGVAGLVLAVDQITKAWAVRNLELGPCTPESCIDLIGSLRFHRVDNPGAAFSLGQDLPLGPVLTVVGVVMSVVLIRLAGRSPHKSFATLTGTIAGGALGNVTDRITRANDGLLDGHVVDFIDLQWWPVFNVADIAIVCGIGAIALFGTKLYPSDNPAADGE